MARDSDQGLTREELEEDLARIEDEITVEPGEYPWALDEDEDRRCFIVQHVGLDYGVAYLEEIFQWMKTGIVPTKAKPHK